MTLPLGFGAPCPCGSGRPFAICCEPLLSGRRAAATARELMRSRFTAHAIHDEAYLHRTFARTAHRPYVAGEGQSPKLTWTRLEIHGDLAGTTPDAAFVEFSAHYRDETGEHVMREKSEFRRVEGQWLYTRAV
jgi:SEC-C motif domain protein